ncbi:MAG: endo alpha-1,4 polygalactosaminidase [Actinomycetota bacterium]
MVLRTLVRLVAGIVVVLAATTGPAAVTRPATAAVSTPAPRLPAPVACPGCWHPALNTSWQWQLSGTVDTSVDVQMYDIDLFDNAKSVVDGLHADGRIAVCYVSAGSRENWRPDTGDFPDGVVGKPLDGWPGERWVDVRKWRVLGPIMRARLNLCAQKGFDGVEFDNVDAWSANTGFPISRDDQLRYNARLANEAHLRGLSAGLKNDVEQAAALEPYFDLAVNEECFRWKECDRLDPFITAGKAVFQVEYDLAVADFCPKANAKDFNSLKKKLSLGAWRVPCR